MANSGDSEAIAVQKTRAESGRRALPNGEDASHIAELDERRVAAEPGVVTGDGKLEMDAIPIHNQTMNCLNSSQDTDLLSETATIINPHECEESKLSERGIHSLTQSVTDEVSRSVSEVDNDDAQFHETEASSKNSANWSPLPLQQQKSRDPQEDSQSENDDDDDFEGTEGEIDSVSGVQSRQSCALELRKRILSVTETSREAPEEEEEDDELSQPSVELQHEQHQQLTEEKLHAVSGHHYTQLSDSDESCSDRLNLGREKTVSFNTKVDAASYLGTSASEPRKEDEHIQQTRLFSESSVFYSQQLNPEDNDSPFSLEDRIRRAREQQDSSLEWESEGIAAARLPTDSIAFNSLLLSNLEEISSSILPELEEIPVNESKGYSERGFENVLHRQVEERRKESMREKDAEVKEPLPEKTGAAEAVLLGALATGVNGPTWLALKAVFVALIASLLLLLYVAVQSGSWFVLLSVLFLITIAGGLIVLLGWYISKTGLVSVEKQMAELNLTGEPSKVQSKTL